MSASAVTEPAVRTEGLTKVYGDRTVVDGLSLTVNPGEVFGLLGPNGAGKTTTILMLLGLTERDGGTVTVGGLDPATDPIGVKRRIGYLPDDVGFYEAMTGRQNLRYTARLNGLPKSDGEARIEELLEIVGLTYAADRPAGTYSRGMRQRLGIADALIGDPDVVVLDEPTIAIDPRGVEQMLTLIRDLAERRGAAVLLSSHLLDQVERICDRVAIFVAGSIRAMGTRAELAAAGREGAHELLLTVPPEAVEQAVAALEGIDGVDSVERDDRPGILHVRGQADVTPRIAPALVDADVALLGLRTQEASLAEVYRRHFDEQPAEGQEVAA